jgi:hypothetical protein
VFIDSLRSELTTAHTEALRVGDSPIRADRLAERIDGIVARLPGGELTDEQRARVSGALADALRVLRRDDDGREAARHLQTATKALEVRVRRPSPFGDEE